MDASVEIKKETQEKGTEKLTDTRSLLLRLDESMKKQENPVERKKVLKSTLQTFTKEQLAMADAELAKGLEDAKVEGADVPAIFKNPEEVTLLRESIAEETRARLSQASQEIESWYKPKTWSPETKKKMEAIGWGVAIGGTAVALTMLWKATRRKASEAANAVGEKVSSIWDKMKWVVGGTVVAGLAFFGIRLAQTFSQISNLKNQLDIAQKEAAKLEGKAKELAEAKVKALKDAIAELEKKVKEQKPNANETPLEKAKKKGDEIADNPAAKNIEENVEKFAIVKGMLLFEPTQETWTASEGTKHEQLTDLIDHPRNANMPIETILSARSQPFTVKDDAGDIPSREQGALYIWNFCKKHADVVRDNKEKTGLTLKTFLEKVAETYSGGLALNETLQDAKGNVLEAMKKFNGREAIMKSKGLKREMRTYIESTIEGSGLTKEEIEKLDWIKLIEIFSAFGGTISGGTIETSDPSIDKILNGICESMKDDSKTNIHKYMLPFFHRVLPRAAWDNGNMDKNLKEVHGYLTARMPRHQALRIGFYAHLIKNGNPVGIVLMQSEVLKYIATEEQNIFSTDHNKALVRIIKTISSVGSDKLSAEWAALDIKIDQTVVDKGLNVLKGGAEQALNLGAKTMLGTALEVGKTGLETVKEASWTDLAIAGGLTGTAAEGGHYLYRRGRINPEHIKDTLKAWSAELDNSKALFDPTKNNLRKLSGILPSHEDFVAAGKSYVTLYEEIQHLHHTSPAHAELMSLLKKCISTPGNSTFWQELEVACGKNGLSAARVTANQFANNAFYRSVVNTARLPFRKGIIATPLWAYDRARTLTLETAKALKNSPVITKSVQAVMKNPQVMAMLNRLKTTPQAFLQALKNAKLLKAGGKAIPYVGASIQWYIYTFIDEPEWQDQLEKETDPLKKQVIENEMFSAKINWELDALGAPAALSIPGMILFIGNFARQFTNESIVEGTKYMLQDRKDLIGKNPGDILAEIQKSSPGDMATYGQRIASVGETKAFEAGNTSARGEAYAAYFEQSVILPPITEELLTAEEKKDPERKAQRLGILEQDQVKYYAQSALAYIANATKNTFVMVSPEILHNAELYAKRAWGDWRQERIGKGGMFTKLSWAEKEKVIAQNVAEEKSDRLDEISEQIDAGESPSEVLPYHLLSSMKEDLAFAESSISNTSAALTGFSDWSELIRLRWTNEGEMKQIARALFAEKLSDKLHQICASTSPITKETFESARNTLLDVLKKNSPNALAKEGLKSSKRNALAEKGGNEMLLSAEGVIHLFEEAQTTNPQKKPTPPSAQSKTNAPTQAA